VAQQFSRPGRDDACNLRGRPRQNTVADRKPPFAASLRFLAQASTSVIEGRPPPSISASATKTDSNEFRARFRSLYDGRENFAE
jgi:hypothetical protein